MATGEPAGLSQVSSHKSRETGLFRHFVYFLSIGPATWLHDRLPSDSAAAFWYAELYVHIYSPLFALAELSETFETVLICYIKPWLYLPF